MRGRTFDKLLVVVALLLGIGMLVGCNAFIDADSIGPAPCEGDCIEDAGTGEPDATVVEDMETAPDAETEDASTTDAGDGCIDETNCERGQTCNADGECETCRECDPGRISCAEFSRTGARCNEFGTNGCTRWDGPLCDGRVCINDQGSFTCEDGETCDAPGTSSCMGGSPVFCEPIEGTNYGITRPGDSCETGEVCVDGLCVCPANSCDPNGPMNSRCFQGDRQICRTINSNCGEWVDESTDCDPSTSDGTFVRCENDYDASVCRVTAAADNERCPDLVIELDYCPRGQNEVCRDTAKGCTVP